MCNLFTRWEVVFDHIQKNCFSSFRLFAQKSNVAIGKIVVKECNHLLVLWIRQDRKLKEIWANYLEAHWNKQSSQVNCTSISFQKCNHNRHISVLGNRSSLHLQHCQGHNAWLYQKHVQTDNVKSQILDVLL